MDAFSRGGCWAAADFPQSNSESPGREGDLLQGPENVRQTRRRRRGKRISKDPREVGGGLRGSSPANRHHPAGNNLRSAACWGSLYFIGKVGRGSDRVDRAQSTEKSLFTFHPYNRKAGWETHEPCRKGENRATIANESRATTSAAALLPFACGLPRVSQQVHKLDEKRAQWSTAFGHVGRGATRNAPPSGFVGLNAVSSKPSSGIVGAVLDPWMMPLDRVRHVRRSSNIKLEAAKQCVEARALPDGVMYGVLRVRMFPASADPSSKLYLPLVLVRAQLPQQQRTISMPGAERVLLHLTQ
ncbi:hypothetical protein CPAR01_04138 [Colletotrichum paranaense]|uniref:Uncharacterized protein n=1 Tax=Colletotrichum paranaense TaxID=1914294 RepID=A0ABQ9SVF7_9PEZI|nr:uncharacterized protein CPAR01_04138 [Colletotrichum paranaense]KAK1543505.1 hypothetical protein CPAR01_04138 [Colletotrichum paranaense]